MRWMRPRDVGNYPRSTSSGWESRYFNLSDSFHLKTICWASVMCQVLFMGKQNRWISSSNRAYILVRRKVQEMKYIYIYIYGRCCKTTGKEMSGNKGKLLREDSQERCVWGSDIWTETWIKWGGEPYINMQVKSKEPKVIYLWHIWGTVRKLVWLEPREWRS